MNKATSDEEAQSQMYILRHTEPCPGCGARTQRDADAAGCPNVTCPVCGSLFRCFTVKGNADLNDAYNMGLGASTQYQLCRLVEATAASAEENEQLRKRLSLRCASGLLSLLTD